MGLFLTYTKIQIWIQLLFINLRVYIIGSVGMNSGFRKGGGVQETVKY